MQFSYNALGQEFLRQSQAGFANSSHYTATGLLAHQRAGRGTESFLQSLHDNPLQPPISTDVHRGYQYDKAFNLVNIDDVRWNRTQYRYNTNDQIVETQYSNQFERQSEKFQYDNNLNITEHQFIPSDAQGAFLQLAQQQQKGRVTRRITAKGYQDYHYDINGRLTQKVVYQHGFRAKTWYYQWNTLNQLIACFNPEGECWRYTYDAFGRRLNKSKVVDNRPTPPLSSPFKDKRVQRVDYLWSGNQMVQETPIYADGTPAYDSQIQWLYQPNEITPTARYQCGKLHYVVTDHQGTPREIFSEKGIVSWAGRLNTWGQMAFWQSHDNYADNDPEYTECHFRFAGQYEDKESGLYYNRFRYYDKDTGQYISPDPIGLLGGFNPYGYVHCPTGWVDPFGLSDKDIVKVRHHTSVEGLEGIKRDQSIWPARGEPIGIHVEVAPFGDAHNGGYAVGANGKGSYVEFEVRRDTLVKTFIWSERNTAIIASNQPLSLKDKKAVFKKQSWWSRMMKGGCK